MGIVDGSVQRSIHKIDDRQLRSCSRCWVFRRMLDSMNGLIIYIISNIVLIVSVILSLYLMSGCMLLSTKVLSIVYIGLP